MGPILMVASTLRIAFEVYQAWQGASTTVVFASDCPDPGLKAPVVSAFFRGLKPPAPSGISYVQLSYQSSFSVAGLTFPQGLNRLRKKS